MIVTVTPAPAMDWTLNLDTFNMGSVNRAENHGKEVSGKGVNISWALMKQGFSTHTIFPAGGHTAELAREVLENTGMNFSLIPTSAEMRTNVTLVVPGFGETKINTSMAPLKEHEIDQLISTVSKHCDEASTVVIAGSLPMKCPPSLHRDLTEIAHQKGARAIVDASGDSLALALSAEPDLIKPNSDELSELTGLELVTLGDVEIAAQLAISKGAIAVLASLGADGMMLVDSQGSLLASATDVKVVNAVGAGDATLAGFIAGGPDRFEALQTAVLWGSSAVSYGTTLFEVKEELNQRITILESFDRNQALREKTIIKEAAL